MEFQLQLFASLDHALCYCSIVHSPEISRNSAFGDASNLSGSRVTSFSHELASAGRCCYSASLVTSFGANFTFAAADIPPKILLQRPDLNTHRSALLRCLRSELASRSLLLCCICSFFFRTSMVFMILLFNRGETGRPRLSLWNCVFHVCSYCALLKRFLRFLLTCLRSGRQPSANLELPPFSSTGKAKPLSSGIIFIFGLMLFFSRLNVISNCRPLFNKYLKLCSSALSSCRQAFLCATPSSVSSLFDPTT